jgi:hypothetical protein
MTSDPSPHPPAALIERLQRRRTRLAFTQFVFFAIWQVNFFALRGEPVRLVDHVKVAAYIVWSVVLLAFIGTGGGWTYPREVRTVLNDESTLDHRRRSMAIGFWAAMVAAIGSYVVGRFEPLAGQDVLHAVLTAGIGAALLAFGILERRAQREA